MTSASQCDQGVRFRFTCGILECSQSITSWRAGDKKEEEVSRERIAVLEVQDAARDSIRDSCLILAARLQARLGVGSLEVGPLMLLSVSSSSVAAVCSCG